MSSRPGPQQHRPQLVITSTVGRIGCWLLSAAAVAGCVDEGWHHGALAALRLAGPLLLVSGVCWTLWGWPRLVLDADRLQVDNALRRTVVPWDALDSAEVRWGLVLHAGRRSIRVPAAPLRSGLSVAARRQSPDDQQAKVEMALAVDRRVTLPMDAATACVVVEQRRQDHRTALSQGLRSPASSGVRMTWQWSHLVLLACGIIGTAWVLLG